ncbi:uncharacterized protein MONOS_4649 [Monocercomonoides exilis]|uniref:uncharacterized protein n=1 Tax=Monocercomonoides exilis TaxID=2049356 RepID=UPI00355A507E|nr:hypothetical protein MONOS_4649 [Monocercomonoides exilis]|eukprot:MONOS_4649.1-p1 / transcript=MONOS_4649.1 / gene=MONOS_4649 / organism=Monocercomonoides_exilis_PA203 / gene_product=unspecified product / transcript_product=unspecified product / location=Mono_scaffold00126:832-1886(-) / protein_length=330 / sequence_SO=supercontig / SO=protein_coding / is_pseudo=false
MTFEEEKKEEKNEKLLVGLCECYLLFYSRVPSSEFLSICVPCLLKAALKKEESEKAQKEVEIALLAFSNINEFVLLDKELYLNEVTEITKYHQEHHNLTHLAYQSAWGFLINRLDTDESLDGEILNELHFGRESARELEELTKCVNWKKEKEEDKKGKDTKEELIKLRWIETLEIYFLDFTMWKEGYIGLINSLVQLFRAAKDNHREIGNGCLDALRHALENRDVTIDDLFESGVVGFFLVEMKQSTLDDDMMWNCLDFFLNVSERLKEKTDGKTDETERKELKRKIFERKEEEGFEDVIASFYGFISFVDESFHYDLPSNILDYFVNV